MFHHTLKINLPKWGNADAVRCLMGVLNNAPPHQSALFVGGCVRNTLLNEPVTDIDIATKHTPDHVMALCAAAGIKTIPTGIDHGTVTAVLNNKNFEITTLRKDIETDGRRAVVCYTDDWCEDAQRRDFTINTLLMDTEGHIYDPTGQGIDDLNARRVVFVGDPAGRIAEDVLRILRFFRFHGYYGAGAPDKAALTAIRAAAGKISSLSRERITQEMFKIIMLDDPADILTLMFDHGVLADLAHVAYKADVMHGVSALQNKHNHLSRAARLLVLAGLDMMHFGVLERYLITPKAIQNAMNSIRDVLALPALNNDHAVKVAVYKHGRNAATQALIITHAKGEVDDSFFVTALNVTQNWDIPTCPVNGQDLIAQGFNAGPALGDKLRDIEQRWIESGFTATKETLM